MQVPNWRLQIYMFSHVIVLCKFQAEIKSLKEDDKS